MGVKDGSRDETAGGKSDTSATSGSFDERFQVTCACVQGLSDGVLDVRNECLVPKI